MDKTIILLFLVIIRKDKIMGKHKEIVFNDYLTHHLKKKDFINILNRHLKKKITNVSSIEVSSYDSSVKESQVYSYNSEEILENYNCIDRTKLFPTKYPYKYITFEIVFNIPSVISKRLVPKYYRFTVTDGYENLYGEKFDPIYMKDELAYLYIINKKNVYICCNLKILEEKIVNDINKLIFNYYTTSNNLEWEYVNDNHYQTK
jgi:hypothetical protein